MFGLDGVEKREVIPDSAALKKTTSFFCQELQLNPLYEFGDRTESRKNS